MTSLSSSWSRGEGLGIVVMSSCWSRYSSLAIGNVQGTQTSGQGFTSLVISQEGSSSAKVEKPNPASRLLVPQLLPC